MIVTELLVWEMGRREVESVDASRFVSTIDAVGGEYGRGESDI